MISGVSVSSGEDTVDGSHDEPDLSGICSAREVRIYLLLEGMQRAILVLLQIG
jgi:hypothetical protein